MKLKKIKVSTGIFWVQIPDINFYMVCGCPEDSVKHLMKRGLITELHHQNFLYENGPNVILLSDILVQNGQFSNLAEFPVLQMLYRQGMNIPDHPGNTGSKPLIIGLKSQVDAQMEYIYRGNYGLVSAEELISAGLQPEKAYQMMRLKNKYAFGKIKKSDEFLDIKYVENEDLEIVKDVFIRRLQTNVFEISYLDEKVSIDLNLQPHQNYEQVYQLGYQNINREYFAVIHSGEGDGWDINRPSMSSIIMYQGKIYLIDAGPNIIYSLNALGIGINEVEGIFHTHGHDDHFCGLTQLIRSDHKIKYFAVPYVRHSIFKKLSALLSQPVKEIEKFFNFYDLIPNKWNNFNDLEVKPLFSPHPVETTIFMFRSPFNDGYKTYSHFADIIDLTLLEKMIVDDDSRPGVSQELYETVKHDYLKPADIKKIDIGGGYIHGNAKDFVEDKSKKILLAHTALQLTQEQKEIGSNAPFGMIDVLIPTYDDFIRKNAYKFLRKYFPSVSEDNLEIIINNPIEVFNPGSIIFKSGQVIDSVYLILTGIIEMLNHEKEVNRTLSSGTIIGDTYIFNDKISTATYRTISNVKALKISIYMFYNFAEKNNFLFNITNSAEKNNFINSIELFSENISYLVQKNIIENMKLQEFKAGTSFPISEYEGLFIIENGKFEIYIGDQLIETIERGEYWGEYSVLFEKPEIFEIKVIEDAKTYNIAPNILKNIPIIHWKLLETYEKRKSLLLNVY